VIRLETLGAPSLRGPGGAEIRAVLAQPKRLALLTYLALAQPRGFHRRDEEALRWYESFPSPTARDFVYLAPAHLGRARLCERLGRRAEAAAHYARAIELWQDSDPEFRSLVAEAERGLARARKIP